MRRALSALAFALTLPAVAQAQRFQADSAFLAQFRWRSIGPANMTGRITDIEAIPQNPRVIYAAFATGGVWKSVNAGTTWQSIFDATGAHAASEIAIAPSDTSVVWVGTGEVNSRNSMSPGNGIYKSIDGGRTWTHMGLRETQHIGRILIHPTDPNTVWVAALGQAWGTNRERGIYKTTDGGQTWRQVKFISERAGFVDMALDPANPNVLYATSWERLRGPYFLTSGGPGSGLWRSADGGETWTPVTGNGLPATTWGRSGVAIAPSNPGYVYLIVEADSAPNPESVRAARQRGFVPDTTRRAQFQSGLFRSTDAGQTWTRMNNENNRPFYYSQLRVDPRNPDRVYWLATNMKFSNDGGRTYRQIGQGIHGDYHALWIDPSDPDHYIVGEDGGIAQTFDRGRTYDAMLQMAVGQFYAVSVDMQRPFWVCGGIQDNGSWCGPSHSLRGAIRNEEWFNIGGGDGFYTAQDPTDPDVVYSESQGGAIQRRNLRTWESQGIRPATFRTPGGGGFGGGQTLARRLEDSVIIARGDTTQPLSAAQQLVVDSLLARIYRDSMVLTQNRYNWSSPFFLSPHNPQTIYFGGNRVWKSTNRGEGWIPISDDLSTRDTARIRMGLALTGGVTRDATNAENHGNVVTLAESPLRPGILFAGTDDGNVWMTRNDGAAWENLTGRFPGVPRNTWVTRVDPSNFDSATVYVTFDGHRTNDFHPYVFVSNDFGRTFRSIATGIPATEYVHVITENPRRRDLLFLGTELSAYVSTNRGESWQRFGGGLPPVPVHDLVVHPRDRQLVAGTHGRSIWVVNIGPLEQATDELLGAPVAVFAPEPALLFNSRTAGGGVGARGNKGFQAANASSGVRIPIRIRGEEQQIARRPGAPAGMDTAQANPVTMLFGPQAAEFAEQGGFGGGGGGGSGVGAAIVAMLTGGPSTPSGDSVLVVITDAAGDTVRTLTTNARPTALRWITWDMRRSRAPLSAVGVRDSLAAARLIALVRDSLRAANQDSTRQAGTGSPLGLMRDPEPREPGRYLGPMQLAVNPPEQEIRRSRGGGGGGGMFGRFSGLTGGGAGTFVEPGIYLVTIRLNGRDYRQAVRVERPVQTSALSGSWQ